jgi:hypothetical protein
VPGGCVCRVTQGLPPWSFLPGQRGVAGVKERGARLFLFSIEPPVQAVYCRNKCGLLREALEAWHGSSLRGWEEGNAVVASSHIVSGGPLTVTIRAKVAVHSTYTVN